jgi:MFS family permease
VPTISADLHSAKGYTWIGGAYLIASAAGAPIWAKFSDIWGRKPLLLLAAAWFFCSSIVCARSSSMGMLIVGRALQGVASGGCVQLVSIAISDMFSLKERSLYMGFLEVRDFCCEDSTIILLIKSQVMWALAAAAGPILGGVFSQYASWRWIFWINLR